jgi:DNA recombination protein RmuC
LLASLAGGIIGWLVGGSRARARTAAAEASLGELREKIAENAGELAALRCQLTEEQKARVIAETALCAEREKLVEEKKVFAEAQNKLTDVFKALASDVFKGESQSFLSLADQIFQKLRAEAHGDLGKRQEAIQGVVEPLKESL